MFGKIVYINDSVAHIENLGGSSESNDLMNMHIIFEDSGQIDVLWVFKH